MYASTADSSHGEDGRTDIGWGVSAQVIPQASGLALK
jgi:hypothetical protein